MAPPVEIARICTFLCFNVVYLFLGFVHLLVAIDLNEIKTASTLESSTLTSLISLNWIIATLILFVAVFGFVAFCLNKSRLIFAYAILVSVVLALQITNQVLTAKSENELTTIALKTELSKFEFLERPLQDAIQEFQQKNRCCGYEDYRSYYKESEPNSSSKIPSSCCGKYKTLMEFPVEYPTKMGACSFEEYSKTPGCRDRLIEVFEGLADNTYSETLCMTVEVLLDIIQVIAIILSFYICWKGEYNEAGPHYKMSS